tara:strand:+ start:225 stop:1184 length:960 start_codon:yes stop_codon:yes gene_type:complete
MKNKSAVLGYPDSDNLGDFIQSIAATKLMMPEKPLILNRDQLNNYYGPQVKLIMNGWFMEQPENWPPSSSITPLFISFHLNPAAESGMLTTKGILYFKKHQPIGCRDYYTQKTLEEHGIKTYFSGCLTLSLKRADFINVNQNREGVLVVSPFERLLHQRDNIKLNKPMSPLLKGIQKIKQPFKMNKYKQAIKRLDAYLSQLDEEVQFRTQLRPPKIHTEEERIKAAEEQLEAIASSKLVVTSRIHSALPAVAFGTPVLFLSDGLEHPNQKSRLEGMETFFRIITSRKLKSQGSDLPEPKKIPKAILNRFEKELRSFLKD